jgi:hypothetical protein
MLHLRRRRGHERLGSEGYPGRVEWGQLGESFRYGRNTFLALWGIADCSEMGDAYMLNSPTLPPVLLQPHYPNLSPSQLLLISSFLAVPIPPHPERNLGSFVSTPIIGHDHLPSPQLFADSKPESFGTCARGAGEEGAEVSEHDRETVGLVVGGYDYREGYSGEGERSSRVEGLREGGAGWGGAGGGRARGGRGEEGPFGLGRRSEGGG